ncbi:MAG: hypothetical protein PHQ22_10690 [Sulfuricurvum sp.]|nr:hypothetical protein [Sulfuricurvum sp.]
MIDWLRKFNKKKNGEKGQAPFSNFLFILVIIAVIAIILPMITTSIIRTGNIQDSINTLKSNGYIVLAAGECVPTNLLPCANATYNIGSTTAQWNTLYINDISGFVNYAGMYRHESAAVTTIQHQNDWHLVNEFITGYMGGGWYWHVGEQLAITAYADNGDGRTRVTDAGHTLINGDIISISGTTSYDGVWIVQQVAVNTFVIDTAFVLDDGISVGEHGSHFHSASPTSAGKYLVTYSLSLKPNSPNCFIEASVFYNATQETKSESETKLGAITDTQNVAGFSIVDVSVNGVISLGIRNTTDTGDFVIKDGNMTLVKLD